METTPRDPWFDPVRARPVLTAVLAVAVCALLTVRLGPAAELPAFLAVGVLGSVLSVIDVALKRLPDPLTGTAAVAAFAVLAVADPGRLKYAVFGALALFAFYGIQWFVMPSQIGFGDVKLAVSLGLLLGWLGLPAWIGGVFAIHLLGGAWALGMIVARRGGRGASLPFGPVMAAGTLVSVLIYG
ncbi:hypothetical protein GCM10027589_40740 [Actinocorallia lasiicapitis]